MINVPSCVGLDASMLLLSIQSLDLQTIQMSPKPAKKQSSRRDIQFCSIYLSAKKYCDR